MSDDDLIRRGDAIAAVERGFAKDGSDMLSDILELIRTLPAAQPPAVQADPVADAARVLLDGSPLLTAFCSLMFAGRPVPKTYADCDRIVCATLRSLAGTPS